MEMIDIFYIAVIWVCILDLSGFIESFEFYLKRKLEIKGQVRIPRPFSCSLCMTFWTGLIYLIFTGQFSVHMVAFLLVVSILTPEIKDIILVCKELINKILNKLC